MSCEAHGDEDMQHGPAVEPSDDSAYDSAEMRWGCEQEERAKAEYELNVGRTPCYMCEGSGVWSTCNVTCRDCNGKGYVLGERDTLTNELFPELSMYGGRLA